MLAVVTYLPKSPFSHPSSVITTLGTAVGSSSTRFRVELAHLKGSLQLCARCRPGGPRHVLDS